MNSKKNFKRGQSYGIEMIFFVIVSLVIIYTLFSVYSTLLNLNQGNKRHILAWSASDVLIKTRGISSNWEENGNLSVLGIANGMNVIDPAKLSALSALSDEEMRNLLRFETSNVSIQILVGGSVYFEKGQIFSNKTINQIERTCVFINGTPCMLRIRYVG